MTSKHSTAGENGTTIKDRYFQAVGVAREGRIEEARQEFMRILREKPDHIESWGQLAYFHELADEPKKAIECYRKILAIDPGFALARLKLANCHLALRETKEARRAFLSLRGTEFENLAEVRQGLAQTEPLFRRAARRFFPLAKKLVRRCADGRFLVSVSRELLGIPQSFPAIREVGTGAYLSYLSQHYLQDRWYRHPISPCDFCGDEKFTPVFYHRYQKIVRCRGCGLEFVERRPAQGMDVLTDHYSKDRTVEGFEELGWRDENLQQGRLNRLQELFRNSGMAFPSLGARILEIGFGEGYFLRKLADSGFRVRGTETSDRLVEFARKRHSLDVFRSTISELTAEEGPYRLLLAYHVLEHLDRPSELFRKARLLLEPGGFLFLELPVADLSTMPLGKKRDESIGYANLYHMHFFTPRTLPPYFEKYGFELVGTYTLYPDTHPTGGFLGRRL